MINEARQSGNHGWLLYDAAFRQRISHLSFQELNSFYTQLLFWCISTFCSEAGLWPVSASENFYGSYVIKTYEYRTIKISTHCRGHCFIYDSIALSAVHPSRHQEM